MSKNVQDLQEELQKLVDNGPRLDEDQANVLKVAACLLAATAVKQARNKTLRNDRRKKSVWVREWLLNRDKYGMYEKLMKHLEQGDVKSFRNFVRMDPGMFNQMVEDLKPLIQKKRTNWRKPLPAGLKLAITLRYLATGNSYKSLAYGFRVAPNTIVSIVSDVCQAIYDKYSETAFKFPTTTEEWKKVAQDFSGKWNFQHCCGCIDGKHVRIIAPPHSGSQYYNYKGYFSIIMLALVDAQYKFMYVDVGTTLRPLRIDCAALRCYAVTLGQLCDKFSRKKFFDMSKTLAPVCESVRQFGNDGTTQRLIWD